MTDLKRLAADVRKRFETDQKAARDAGRPVIALSVEGGLLLSAIDAMPDETHQSEQARWRVMMDVLVGQDKITADGLAILAGQFGLTLMSDEAVWTNLWQGAVAKRALPDKWFIDELHARGYYAAKVSP